MTVLANEQAIDGRGWRSGALVEKRKLNQWFLRITQFADDLVAGLGDLKGCHKVRLMQENWIGRVEGSGSPLRSVGRRGGRGLHHPPRHDLRRQLRRGRGDHPIAQGLTGDPEVAAFIARCKQGGTTAAELETQEKLGFDTGLTAAHPFSGELLPVYIANFVLMDYGTGAVFGVPAHSPARFRLRHQICAADPPRRCGRENIIAPDFDGVEAYTGPGTLVNSHFLDGMRVRTRSAR
ncbi:hypothetical protein AB5I41_21235 [Sphingomonas sp. MMS24-JH45]